MITQIIDKQAMKSFSIIKEILRNEEEKEMKLNEN